MYRAVWDGVRVTRRWIVLVAFVASIFVLAGAAWYAEHPRPSPQTSEAPDPNYDGPCCIAVIEVPR
jgi:hypothetical protein